LQGFQALGLQMGCAALAAPEGLMVMAWVLAKGQAGLQGAGCRAASLLAQSGLAENAAGMHGGNSVEAAQLGQAEPVGATAGERAVFGAGSSAGVGGFAAGHGNGDSARILLTAPEPSIRQVENVTMGH
jgi:hypothetical protein